MFRFLGLGAMLFAAASAASAGERYVEVWNPPEARASTPRRTVPARRPASGRHLVPRALKARARPATVPAPAARLMAKADRRGGAGSEGSAAARAPDMPIIPRQITPEGNVLRVGSGGIAPEVMR